MNNLAGQDEAEAVRRGAGEMLLSLIDRPKDDEEGRWMSLKELSALIKQHFTNYKEDAGSFQKIGQYLSRPEYKFQMRHTTGCNIYWVKVRVS